MVLVHVSDFQAIFFSLCSNEVLHGKRRLWSEGKLIATNPVHLTITLPLYLKFTWHSKYDLWPTHVAYAL